MFAAVNSAEGSTGSIEDRCSEPKLVSSLRKTPKESPIESYNYTGSGPAPFALGVSG